jgi:hypothetical protein
VPQWTAAFCARRDFVGVKRLIFALPIVATFLASLGLTSAADQEKTVTASVIPITIAMTLSTDTISYGSLQAGNPEVPSDPNKIDIINKGSVVQNFDIMGGDSNGWTLASTPGQNQFMHTFSTGGTPKPLTKSYQSLITGVGVDGEINLFMKFTMPTSYTTTGVQSFPIMIRASMQ